MAASGVLCYPRSCCRRDKAEGGARVAKFHFVEDYETLVAYLLDHHTTDEAMAMAVGGDFVGIGEVERDILIHAGLRRGMSVIDVGCGSGRLSQTLTKAGPDVEYLGTDIVDALLDYAASKSRPHYEFKLHRELSIPAADASADFICFFSVFTHLLHHESYIYLKDAARCLRPGGQIVFSFLEFAEEAHWSVFEATAAAQQTQTLPHLNTFLERGAIALWARQLGFREPRFIDAGAAIPGSKPLGQTVSIWTR